MVVDIDVILVIIGVVGVVAVIVVSIVLVAPTHGRNVEKERVNR